MADEKHPMQADGGGKPKGDNPVPGKGGAGESGGGAYPNPHTGGDRGSFEGGQSEVFQKTKPGEPTNE